MQFYVMPQSIWCWMIRKHRRRDSVHIGMTEHFRNMHPLWRPFFDIHVGVKYVTAGSEEMSQCLFWCGVLDRNMERCVAVGCFTYLSTNLVWNLHSIVTGIINMATPRRQEVTSSKEPEVTLVPPVAYLFGNVQRREGRARPVHWIVGK
jgi:hypothetical protein